MDEKMKFKVVVAEGSLKAERGRIEAGAEEARRLQEFDELKGMELEVLGVPFGGHIMGRDAYGEAFHPGTDIWMMDGSSVPVTYYHGFGPDDPYDWQKSPAVIGTAKLIGMDEDGFRFLVRLDEEEELALRVKKAVEAGEDVKASSGAVGHLVRYGRAGLIDVWPVGELAIFDTNEWRRPANELAVVEKAGEKRIHPLINTNKHELEIASTQEQRLAMTEFHSDGTKTVNEITYSMVVPVLNQETKAAPEAADEAVKGAARLGREAVQQEEQVKPSDELVDDQTEEKMDELEMKALIDGVVGAIAPMIDEKLNARMNVEKGGVATQVQVKTDEADQPWAKPGDFFKAVKMAALYPGSEDARLRPLKATGMSEGVPADGGYLVPTETAAGNRQPDAGRGKHPVQDLARQRDRKLDGLQRGGRIDPRREPVRRDHRVLAGRGRNEDRFQAEVLPGLAEAQEDRSAVLRDRRAARRHRGSGVLADADRAVGAALVRRIGDRQRRRERQAARDHPEPMPGEPGP